MLASVTILFFLFPFCVVIEQPCSFLSRLFSIQQEPDPVQALLSDGGSHTIDICIANILRGPLLDLQPQVPGYVKRGGHALLSGVLTSQVRNNLHISTLELLFAG